jgi:hypothetical protein
MGKNTVFFQGDFEGGLMVFNYQQFQDPIESELLYMAIFSGDIPQNFTIQ